MENQENIKEIINKVISILSESGANKISIFGSYARGEASLKSDLDILVEFSQRKSLLEIVRIERILSETLGIRVDLLTEKSISPYLIEGIKKEAEVIFS